MSEHSGRKAESNPETSQNSVASVLALPVDSGVSPCMCNQINQNKSSLAVLLLEIATFYQTLGSRRAWGEEPTQAFVLTSPQLSLSHNLCVSQLPVPVETFPLDTEI